MPLDSARPEDVRLHLDGKYVKGEREIWFAVAMVDDRGAARNVRYLGGQSEASRTAAYRR
jgi:hypothetical protein